MNINTVSIVLLRDYKKEQFDLSPSTYMGFSPVMEPGSEEYRRIHPHKSDPLCYIKHLTKEFWLYLEDGKPVFRRLKRADGGSIKQCCTEYVPPQVFFIDYIDQPLFFMYVQDQYGLKKVRYLNYVEKDGRIRVKLSESRSDATIFSYNRFTWTHELNHNLHAKGFHLESDDRINFDDVESTCLKV